MIQVVEESFLSIEKAKAYANNIGLRYKEIKDINIICNNRNEYMVIVKLEINECYPFFYTFDFVEIKKKKSDAANIKYIWEIDYDIEFQDKRLKEIELFNSLISRSSLCKNKNEYSYELTAHFGFKDWITLIEIKNFSYNNHEIILRAFRCNDGYLMFGMLNYEKEHFFTEKVDGKIIYKHIVNVYKQRGYLFDKFSLETLEQIGNDIAKSVNQDFIREKLEKI